MCCKFDPCAELIKTVDVQLAQVRLGGAASADVGFRVTNPTKKFALTLNVFVRPGNNGAGVSPAAHSYTNETWQLWAVAAGNPEVTLNAAFFDNSFPPVATPRPLPDSYDIEDGVKVVRGVAHAVNNGNPVGQLYILRAIWEPVDADMGGEERKYWFAQCEAKADVNEPTRIGTLE